MSFISTLLAKDLDGRVKTTLGAMTNFNGGTPASNLAQLAVTNTLPSPDIRAYGLRFDATGALYALSGTTGIPIVGYINGLPVNVDGALMVENNGAIANYLAGLAFTAVGRVATEQPDAAFRAFSDGFSPGFY